MFKPSFRYIFPLSLVLGIFAAACPAADAPRLWEIGQPDGKNAEFALAPGNYSKFRQDGFFVIGQSDPKRDWPYAQPGPVDSWAGSRAHTFSIVFGIKGTIPASGNCKLVLDLVDAQQARPPRLRIDLNGKEATHQLAGGGGDESIKGQPEKGKRQHVEIVLPAAALRPGANTLTITTVSGSWMLFDALAFEAPAEIETAPAEGTVLTSARPLPALKERDGKLVQVVRLTIQQLGAAAEATVRIGDNEPAKVQLQPGAQTIAATVPEVTKETTLPIRLEVDGRTWATESVVLKPVPKRTIYILPHSHTDIGYTEVQTKIEEKQVNNLLQGIEYARKTAGYPAGARFVWNVEVLWAADLYLNRLSEAQKADFLAAVKSGQVSLNGMYLNELTGLCRTEELLRLFRYSTELSDRCGVPIDSAMISDVPGYTWGTVTAMSHAGIRYFSTAPNFFDRIGDILVKWENKPFWWISPSGKEKVLVWIPTQGYALSHVIGKLSTEFVADYQEKLSATGYPYDITHLRWSGHGDNAVPDPSICEFIKDWNTEYVWPKFIISSTSQAFRAFEERYGEKLPEVRGDWTPYWEDGAGSSALETGLNRASADRLTQAEALWACATRRSYPPARFEEAWRNVLLYSEHTWGAYCSISEPENPLTRDQWAIKQSYALQAEKQSRALLDDALKAPNGSGAEFDVINTTSWPRTELVLLPKAKSATGDRVTDDRGEPVPSQRLADGALAFLARDVPPFAARRYTLSQGTSPALEGATAQGATLDNGRVHVRVSEKTGGIAELRARGIDANLVDDASGMALNEYLYLIGDDLADLQRGGPASITVVDKGPLVASLRVESDAPGCNRLRREIRLVAGSDAVEVNNTVDKKRLAAKSYHAKDGKECINFAFPFHVPDGRMLLDLPIGAMQPERDQMPSACKNWLTVGRWADVSNADYGVTWVTLDAPLVEVGELSATLLNSQTNPDTWRKTIEPTQRLYSWAMNNHWGTNYRAYQEGPTPFRFVLRPHRQASPADAARFAVGQSQPLIVVPAAGPRPRTTPLLSLSSPDVLVVALKPSDDRKAWIVHLYGASGRDTDLALTWADPRRNRSG